MFRRALAFALSFAILSGALPAAASARTERHAALILDANTGAVLHGDDADELRHPASLTKMMTLYLTFETLESGRLKMSDMITISERAAAVAPSKLDLAPGDAISVSDAVKAVITKSANDIAVALAEKIGGSEANFVRLMNTRAREIGMSKTHFENASGLPNDDQVTTARDMATLALHLQDDYPAYYPLFATSAFSYQGKTYRNHNTMLNNFAGIDGIKTGYTRASGFNLVTSLRRGGRHLIGVVFGGETAAARNGEMRILLTRALARASTVKSRKPMLLAKLKVGPKLAERPAAKRQRTALTIGPAEPPAAKKPQPVTDATNPPGTASQNEQGANVAETPVRIFRVRTVPLVPRPPQREPSPDQTTDMEGLENTASDTASPIGLGAPGRTDFGRLAEAATSPLSEPVRPFAAASLTPEDETLIAKSELPDRHTTSRDEHLSMLGASDTVPAKATSASPFAPAAAGAPPATGSEPASAIATSRSATRATSTSASAQNPGPVRRGLPPSTLNAQAQALQAKSRPASAPAPEQPAYSPKTVADRYEVQIGAYGSIGEAERALTDVQGRAGRLLAGVASVTHPTVKNGHQIYRARFTGFDANRAASTCNELRRQAVDCFVMAAD